jgi:hypothetical protein
MARVAAHRGGDVLLGLAAILWLAAMALPMTTRGNGSTLSGHELADLASSGRLPGQARWHGLAWYVMPLGGAVVLASLGLRGASARALRFVAAAAATASALLFTVLITRLDVERFGAGTWTAIAGSGLAACALGLTALQHRKERDADVLL